MRIAVTGATGAVGHWIAADLLAAGHAVVALGRRPSRHRTAEQRAFDLGGPAPDLSDCAVLVHAAFAHLPGRYRGGEGGDPDGFLRLNRDGTLRLFAAARAAGVGRVLFLSSRAVYGDRPAGTRLTEDLPPEPDTLYGRMKLAVEDALAALTGPRFAAASLRATGVFGPPLPGLPHKWQPLLDAFARGEPLAPRAATEVHAGDLAAAVRLLATVPAAALAPGVFNVSAFVLDRRDLLARHAALTGAAGPLPGRADAAAACVMDCTRLRALGWRPGGAERVDGVLHALSGAAADDGQDSGDARG